MASFVESFHIFLVICFGATLVNGDCIINIPEDQDQVPQYTRFFGSKLLPMRPAGNVVNIYDNEVISAVCTNGFSDDIKTPRQSGYYNNYDPNYYQWLNKEASLMIRCTDSRPHIKSTHIALGQKFYNDYTLRCSGLKWKLYESPTPYEWCDGRTASYSIGRHAFSGHNITISYICYDVENMKLNTFTYKASPKDTSEKHSNNTAPHWNTTNDSGIELEGFQRILSTSISFTNSHSLATEELSIEVKKNIWLQLANYGYSPIAQNGPYAKYLHEFSAVLDIIWWPNLLQGNWRRFNEALEKHAKYVAYTVTTGTSGIAEVPQWNLLTGELELKEFSFGATNRTIPKYIWSYGRTNEEDKGFLVVSYNSPFFEFGNKEDIVFCKDICDQYEWLREARSTFSYSFIGVTFCCSIEEAIDVLEGLPIPEDFINVTKTNRKTSPNEAYSSSTPNIIV